MNPVIVVVPLAIAFGGLLSFALLPLDLPIRVILLTTDLAAAAVVGILLGRRYNR